MTGYEPNTVSVLSQNIKEGDVIVERHGERLYLSQVSYVDSRVGYMIIRTDNDAATSIYQIDERVSIVQA